MILGFKKNFPDGTPTHFKEKITVEETKLHSIRAGERWRAGMSIEMAYGVRSKNYFQFNKYLPELQLCISVQSVEMDFNLTDHSIGMRIDDRKVDKYVIREVIKNDGLTREQFIEWFFKDSTSFTGQIIHWTSLKYAHSHKIFYMAEDMQFLTVK